MSASLKPFKLYDHARGPNPKKVTIVLEELGLPYEAIVIPDPKAESFTKINPNGRLPALVDPNADDFVIWESGAILEYLVGTYDTEGKLDGRTTAEKWQLKQYLHFQMSGQGPYYGQAVWFNKFHHEDLPSAKARYIDQVLRVCQVLDDILEGKTYLVGEKLTYVDIAFFPWDWVLFNMPLGENTLAQQYDIENKYPNFTAWHKRVGERESAKKAYGQ